MALIKFSDLVKFSEFFDLTYQAPRHKLKLGHYSMMIGILMLLFIGFNWIWHFTYDRLDAMLCGILSRPLLIVLILLVANFGVGFFRCPHHSLNVLTTKTLDLTSETPGTPSTTLRRRPFSCLECVHPVI